MLIKAMINSIKKLEMHKYKTTIILESQEQNKQSKDQLL